MGSRMVPNEFLPMMNQYLSSLSVCYVQGVFAIAIRCICDERYTLEMFLHIDHLVNINQTATRSKILPLMTVIRIQVWQEGVQNLCLLVYALVISNER